MVDFIISIPVNVNVTLSRPNMFFHFLSNEDWYEAQEIQLEESSRFSYQQKVKIVTKDLEAPMVQNVKKGDRTENDQLWEQICYPGSIQCLYKQLKVNKGFYYY